MRRPLMRWPVGTMDRVAAKLKATLPVLEHPDDAPRVFADLLAKMSAEHAALRKAYLEGTWKAGTGGERRPAAEPPQAARAPATPRTDLREPVQPASRPAGQRPGKAAPPAMTEAFVEVRALVREGPGRDGAGGKEATPTASERPQGRDASGSPGTDPGAAGQARQSSQAKAPKRRDSPPPEQASLFPEPARGQMPPAEAADAPRRADAAPSADAGTDAKAMPTAEEEALAKRKARRRAILRSLKRGGFER